MIEQIKQPEYTGENRCTPCTAVNLVIAGVLGVVLALVSMPVGIVVFLVSVGMILSRGYLVPGTPRLTKQYFPEWVLRRFEKLPDNEPIGDMIANPATQAEEVTAGETTTPRTEKAMTIQPTAALSDVGAVTLCETGDDLCLEPGFQAEWRDAVTDLRERGLKASDALHALRVTNRNGSLSYYGSSSHYDGMITLEDDEMGTKIAQWASEAALLADIAGAEVIECRLAGWDDLGIETRGQLLYGLRLFIETCPECDGRVSLTADTVESCCRSTEVAAVTCKECGARLFEHERG